MNLRSAAKRGAKAKLKRDLCRGHVRLADVIHDPLLATLPVHYVCRLAITTRAANLDTRSHPSQRRSHRIVQLLRPLDLIGHEPLGRLSEETRRKVAFRVSSDPNNAYLIRQERS